MELIAKTFKGLEAVLAAEIIELGGNDIQIGNRMVSFTGDKELMYRSNFALRTALRVLMPIKHFTASDPDTVYDNAKDIEWEKYMDVTTTFVVDSNVFSNDFRHSQFVAYRIKDAIADHWRDITDGRERPNVRLTNPDIRIDVHIAENDVTISLDSSGESLHRRGYREETVQAPLNEVLAAGIIKLTGWKCDCDFIDPMCGSGTLLIEAALIARNIAPGVFRQDYAFMHWKDYDDDLWQSIYDDDSEEREFAHHIYGYDINRNAVQIAHENVKRAGLGNIIEVVQRDMADFAAPKERAIMVTNPPYGERITTDDLFGLYETIGTQLKQRFAGCDAYILSGNMECFDHIGLKASAKIPLLNGKIEVELRKYQMFTGRYNDLRASGGHIKTAVEKAGNMRRRTSMHKRDDGERKSVNDKRFGAERKARRFDDDKQSGKKQHTSDRRNSESWEAQRHRKMREMRKFLGKNDK